MEVEEAVCSCCGAVNEAAPMRVGVVVLGSRRGAPAAARTEVASGVVSVRIVRGSEVEGFGWGEMLKSAAWMIAETESVVSVVLMGVGVEVTASSSMANAGQKLVFEGSASGTIEIVNTRPERMPSATLGITSGESVVWYGVQVYVPVFSMEAGQCAKVRNSSS